VAYEVPDFSGQSRVAVSKALEDETEKSWNVKTTTFLSTLPAYGPFWCRRCESINCNVERCYIVLCRLSPGGFTVLLFVLHDCFWMLRCAIERLLS
jgi:hypothetical protein